MAHSEKDRSPNWGGARTGAGRKYQGGAQTAIVSLSLPKDLVEKLDEIARNKEESRNAVLRLAVVGFLTNQGKTNAKVKAAVPDVVSELREQSKRKDPAVVAEAMAMLFSELSEAPVRPFIPDKLNKWGMKQVDEGRKAAARFVLSVWGGGTETPWKIGNFTLIDIMKLSQVSRNHISEFMKNPFWL